MDWLGYCRRLLVTALVLAALLYGFIIVLDPYQNVPFAPSAARAPISTNQRFSYPAVARDPRFDAVIIGTSTSRLIEPRALGAASGAQVANLAMNSATAYEQRRIYELFLRHHPAPRFVVLGVDETWCVHDAAPERYTFRDFPEWMYDEDPWNDLGYLFNDKALEDAVRMAEFLLGRREAKYRPDGYRDFTADFPPYDAAAVRRRLYGGAPRPIADAAILPSREHPEWRFPLLPALADLLAATPAATRVVLLFPPLHAAYIEPRAALFAECKGRVRDLAAARPGTSILDYLFVSPLTRNDDNYWDPVHFTRAVSARVTRDLATALAGGTPTGAAVRYLP
ncbi:MAG: hypothetical protein H6977_13350 [Gammaproteobacteria bacterium]|nr:hypothetical protein [Gammaproteobacteria bacterium]